MLDVKGAHDATEQDRLAELRDYNVLDTPAEAGFDDIVALAAHLCGTPIALVSLVDSDRQWFKARIGLDVCQTSREASFCAHAMHGETVMQVPDARTDPRFADNPLVLGEPHIRFYAGAPLIFPTGRPLGSLCVIDRRPGLLTPAQCQGLLTLARHVVGLLELRRHAQEVEAVSRRLREADRMKDEFLARITHELRTPLTSILGSLEILEDDLPAPMAATCMQRVRRNSERLMRLVDDMLLAAAFTTTPAAPNRRSIDVAALAHDVLARHQSLAHSKALTTTVEANTPVVAYVDGQQLGLALDRLIHNAVTFTDNGAITVRVNDDDGHAAIEVQDTGIGFGFGFGFEDSARLFEPFRRGQAAEQREAQGAGLGLHLVKSVIDAHGGTITVSSSAGGGTLVKLTLPMVQLAGGTTPVS